MSGAFRDVLSKTNRRSGTSVNRTPTLVPGGRRSVPTDKGGPDGHQRPEQTTLGRFPALFLVHCLKGGNRGKLAKVTVEIKRVTLEVKRLSDNLKRKTHSECNSTGAWN